MGEREREWGKGDEEEVANGRELGEWNWGGEVGGRETEETGRGEEGRERENEGNKMKRKWGMEENWVHGMGGER